MLLPRDQVADCENPNDVSKTLQIAIDKPRSMERKQDANQEPELIGAHVQLQKNDAQTNAAKMPVPIIRISQMSICIEVKFARFSDTRPPPEPT